MSAFYVVVDDLEDWKPYFPSQDVISFEQYLALESKTSRARTRVINCCRNSTALGRGYYTSLLAEARRHHVIPSISVTNDLRRKSLWSIDTAPVAKVLSRLAAADQDEDNQLSLNIYFGEVSEPRLESLGKTLFERYPVPVLQVTLQFDGQWRVQKLRQGSLSEISSDDEQVRFAAALDRFSHKIWRKPKVRQQYRYDLAIYVDPEDPMPPSDETALKRFAKAAERLGIKTEQITSNDYQRLAEFDGLFIRATTSIDDATYKFARKAEAEGLVVMDDPQSILRCTNKVYLADLLKANAVPTPKTVIVSNASAESQEKIISEIGLPAVLKIPDGAFSRGVEKVGTQAELAKSLKHLRRSSSLVLAQEYMYTEYDWRIGILNNKPLFACRYFMVEGHWQIYKHGDDPQTPDSGNFDAPPIWEVPHKVMEAALKAARLIGDGLYGVDLKQAGDRVAVIEVNDNPSIDSEVEDLLLGDALYHEIIAEFLRRMEQKRQYRV